MIIESVDLKDYRNYELLNIELSDKTNIIYGDNAQGKTNILEALYLCGTTKSHKGSRDKDMIQFGKDESHIRMMVKRDELSYRIDMHLKKNKAKGVAINKANPQTHSDPTIKIKAPTCPFDMALSIGAKFAPPRNSCRV